MRIRLNKLFLLGLHLLPIYHLEADESEGGTQKVAQPLPEEVAIRKTEIEATVVESIQIECVPPHNIDLTFIKAHIAIHEGDKLDQKQLNETLQTLYRTGTIEKVEVKTKELGDKKVALTFLVTPKYKIRNITFKGNLRYKDRTLLSEIDSKPNEMLSVAKLTTDVYKLKQFYENKGYLSIKATFIVTEETSGTGYKDVVFNLEEGKRSHISSIEFEGNSSIKSKELVEILKTQTWDLLSWLKNTGRYRAEMFEEDLEKIAEYYRNRGFLDVVIDKRKVKLIEHNERLTIRIPIQEGKRYFVGHIALSGGFLGAGKAMDCLVIKEGDPFAPEKIETSCENIRDLYGQYGYLDTQVSVKRSIHPEKIETIDLTLTIEEKQQSTIQSIQIVGNTITQSRVILRELALAPGDLCDRVRMKKAKTRLENTNHFKEVSVVPEPTMLPNKKDVKVTVEEGKTGSVYFSGGINSVEKFTFGVTVGQNNFDYKSPKSLFRGAGQKAFISTEIGKYSNQIRLSFEEPWVFDRELKFGFDAFRTANKYSSSAYDEIRLGTEVYVSKRLFEQVIGRLYYDIEEVNIRNMDTTKVPAEVAREKGKRSISKVGIAFSRDTRNNLVYPTQGSFIELDNQCAGGWMRGQTNYVRQRLTGARWFLVVPENEHVVLVGAKTGYVKGFGGKEVPLFEREFLGGPDDLRGFDYREVGPKSNDRYREPLGGKTFAFGTTEYSIKVTRILRLASFFDIGFLNSKALDWRTSDYNANWGVGVRIFILNAPFRLDFAFPLKSDPYNKHKCKISYSFGVSF